MPTSTDTTKTFLLNSHQGITASDGWRVQSMQNLQATSEGLRLTMKPEPPVLLKDAEGTFGGMENPTGVAVAADGTRYVSDSGRHVLYKIAACREPGVSRELLPCIGGLGTAPRQLNTPRGLAISPAGDMYVADSGNHRIQVFALPRLALKTIWGENAIRSKAPLAAGECTPSEGTAISAAQSIPGTKPGEFNTPWDVIADRNNNIYVADKGNHRVQKYFCKTRRFQIMDGTILAAHFFQVLYGPSRSDRFVYVPGRNRLELWPHTLGADPQNTSDVILCGTEVTSLRKARQLVLEHIDAVGAQDILMENDAAYPVHLETDTPFSHPMHLALDAAQRLYVVDEDREYVKVLDRMGRVLGRMKYVDQAEGFFKPSAAEINPDGELILADRYGLRRFFFDHEVLSGMSFDASGEETSRAVACGFDEKPDATKTPSGYLKNGVLVSGPFDSGIEQCQWHRIVMEFCNGIPLGTSVSVWTATAEQELTAAEVMDADWQSGKINADDFLILSAAGRYLWIKLVFRGNGVDTPLLRNITIQFPRNTYLEYLPAVYQADPVSKDFLGRFLSIFETELSGIDTKIDAMDTLFDPDGAPAGTKDFLSWLAGWVDMTYEPGWSVDVRRRLLRNAPELYKKRGTPNGLKLFLRLALGIEVQILEHFQLRHWLYLSSQSTLGDRSTVWGNCIVKRLQLDEYANIGDFALRGVGDPLHDPFRVYAHAFSVFVQPNTDCPASLERIIRYLIEREKPAHTRFDVVRVEPRFRVGMQSTVGFDTQVGAYPKTVLNYCSTLGYDTLLGRSVQESEESGTTIGRRSRVGVSAVVG